MRLSHARWLPAVAFGLALAQDPLPPTVAPARVGSMAPDDGGAPITGYNLYRGGAFGGGSIN